MNRFRLYHTMEVGSSSRIKRQFLTHYYEAIITQTFCTIVYDGIQNYDFRLAEKPLKK
jgi:hypothetical protein